MTRQILSATIGLVIFLVWADTAGCQISGLINTFEINWNQSKEKEEPRQSALTPPKTSKSKYSWVASTFGPCFGCGSKSYKELKHDCVHKLPMQLIAVNYSRNMTGVYRVPDSECSGVASLNPVSVMGCGRPCSELRLLRGQHTGCRCDHEKKLAFDVPKLVCQDNKNRTVSLSMCKFFYEQNQVDYQAVFCDYNTVCTGSVTWIAGNWTSDQCSKENLNFMTRAVVCAVQSTKTPVYYILHDSMCDARTRPPHLKTCAKWTVEPHYRRCNCITKRTNRPVVCMRFYPKPKRRVPESECSWHIKPNADSTTPCDQKQLAKCRAFLRKTRR